MEKLIKKQKRKVLDIQAIRVGYFIQKFYSPLLILFSSTIIFHCFYFLNYKHKLELTQIELFDRFEELIETFNESANFLEKSIVNRNLINDPKALAHFFRNFQNTSIFVGDDIFNKLAFLLIYQNGEIVGSFGNTTSENLKINHQALDKIQSSVEDLLFIINKKAHKPERLSFSRMLKSDQGQVLGHLTLLGDAGQIAEYLFEKLHASEIVKTVFFNKSPSERHFNLSPPFKNKKYIHNVPFQVAFEPKDYWEYMNSTHCLKNYFLLALFLVVASIIAKYILGRKLFYLNALVSYQEEEIAPFKRLVSYLRWGFISVTQNIANSIKRVQNQKMILKEENQFLREMIEKMMKEIQKRGGELNELENYTILKSESFKDYQVFENMVKEYLHEVFSQTLNLCELLVNKFENPECVQSKNQVIQLLSLQISENLNKIRDFDLRGGTQARVPVKNLLNDVIRASKYFAILKEVSLEINSIAQDFSVITEEGALKLALFGIIFLTINCSPKGSKIRIDTKKVKENGVDMLLIEFKDGSYKEYYDNEKPLTFFEISTINMSVIERMLKNIDAEIYYEYLGKQGRIVTILLKDLDNHVEKGTNKYNQPVKNLGSNVYVLR